MLPMKIFRNKCSSILIRFIMTTDGKYKISQVDVLLSILKCL